MTTVKPGAPASERDYKAALRGILKATAAVIRHTAAAIGWMSRMQSASASWPSAQWRPTT